MYNNKMVSQSVILKAVPIAVTGLMKHTEKMPLIYDQMHSRS